MLPTPLIRRPRAGCCWPSDTDQHIDQMVGIEPTLDNIYNILQIATPISLLTNTTRPKRRERHREEMASLNMAFGVAAVRGRAFITKATKSSGSGEGEKGVFDWIMGGLQKEDQLLETDPILNKVEGKGSAFVSKNSTTTSVSVPSKKKFPGIGSLFAKN